MIEAVLDRCLEDVRHFLHDLRAQIFADAVAAEGKGQPGFLVPPDAGVEQFVQAHLLIRELAFMDDAGPHRICRRTARESRRTSRLRTRTPTPAFAEAQAAGPETLSLVSPGMAIRL